MDKIEQALGVAVLEDFKSVLAAADETGAGPMEWQAITEILPEQAKEWCCKMVDGNVEAGDYSGEMHMIGEIATGRQIAVTGCGPKGAVSAKFLIWAAHFAMKHREALPELLAAAEEAATLRAELAEMKAKLVDCREAGERHVQRRCQLDDEVDLMRTLLDEVRCHFTRDDDLPGGLLTRIDTALDRAREVSGER